MVFSPFGGSPLAWRGVLTGFQGLGFTLRLKIAQKPEIVWSKALEDEPIEPQGLFILCLPR